MTPISQTPAITPRKRTAPEPQPLNAGAVRKPIPIETSRDARLYFGWAREKLRNAVKARKAGDYYNYRRLRWDAAWLLEYRHKLLETI